MEDINNIEVNDYIDLSKISREVDIENSLQVLKRNGYFVDNLWQTCDIREHYKCSEEEAYDILYSALTNDFTMEQIWSAIHQEVLNRKIE